MLNPCCWTCFTGCLWDAMCVGATNVSNAVHSTACGVGGYICHVAQALVGK